MNGHGCFSSKSCAESTRWRRRRQRRRLLSLRHRAALVKNDLAQLGRPTLRVKAVLGEQYQHPALQAPTHATAAGGRSARIGYIEGFAEESAVQVERSRGDRAVLATTVRFDGRRSSNFRACERCQKLLAVVTAAKNGSLAVSMVQSTSHSSAKRAPTSIARWRSSTQKSSPPTQMIDRCVNSHRRSSPVILEDL